MVRVAHLAVAVAVTVALLVAPGRNAPVAEAATVDLLVGDSVMAGMSSASRAGLPGHVFDAKVCRRLISTSCTYRGVRPATALDVVRSWRGVPNRAIVVAAGYNDGSVGAAVDAIVEEARRQGVPHVVWLTYRVAGSNAATYRSHNSVLWQKAQQYPELTIADWAGRSAGRSDWVAADGLHLNGSGAAAMANLIGSVLAGLRPPPPPGPPPLDPGERICFRVPGAAGQYALVNLTPVRAAARGNGVLTAGGVSTQPRASSVNYAPGTTDPNVGIAPVGADGRVCYHNADRSTVHLVADHLATLRGSSVAPAQPDGRSVRVLDTRRVGGAIGPEGRRCFAVGGDPGDVAVMNLTPVGATTRGRGVLVASDVSPRADAPPHVNYPAGAVAPNLGATPIGPDGRICYVNGPTARVHVVVDHLVTIDATDVTFVDATPRRLFDTRGASLVAPGGRRCVAVAGAVGDLAVVNLTPVRAQGRGNGVLVGSGASVTPSVSNVNYQVGSVDPNVGVAAIGGDGRVCYRNADRSAVHLVADHLMTIRASAVAHVGPGRVLDTRR